MQELTITESGEDHVDEPVEEPGEPVAEPAVASRADTGDGRIPWRTSLFRRPSFGGLAVALLFWWKSLSPTMMPRGAVSQAMISAVCIGVALIIGTFISDLVHRLLRRFDVAIPEPVRRGCWIALGVAAAVIGVVGLIVWPKWQNEQRDLLGMDHIAGSSVIVMVIATAVLTVILVLIGRVVWRGIRALDRWAARHLPRSGATIATVVVVAVLGQYFLRAGFDRFESWARDSFADVDDGTDEGVVQPQEPTVSGSPASLIPWDTLGREGRNFVTRAPSEDELRSFPGDRTVERPVRIYAGLASAPDAASRAELAVKDLERAGGFDRSLLVVTTVTGTGWVDPDAALAVEQLWGGDTAMVAIQYSFLPSWISFLVDTDVAQAAGAELFNAVSQRWSELPENDRPKLVVFGQSLGSKGAEAAFAGRDDRTSVANMLARTDGVLFTGPTNSNTIWGQLVDARSDGSTAWLPVYEDGVSVRFANRSDELLAPDASWTFPRVLYIQHPSDPVTFWDFPTMWSEPEWIQDPKGYDIPPRASWFPFVTWAQGVADLAAGFGAKPGYGHDYSNAFVAGWAAVAPPDGWTTEDTVTLQGLLAGD